MSRETNIHITSSEINAAFFTPNTTRNHGIRRTPTADGVSARNTERSTSDMKQDPQLVPTPRRTHDSMLYYTPAKSTRTRTSWSQHLFGDMPAHTPLSSLRQFVHALPLIPILSSPNPHQHLPALFLLPFLSPSNSSIPHQQTNLSSTLSILPQFPPPLTRSHYPPHCLIPNHSSPPHHPHSTPPTLRPPPLLHLQPTSSSHFPPSFFPSPVLTFPFFLSFIS
eukprot:gb/GEZN01011552.1/.p2 GENE.gb/GEZN01011552.1/~~gb/GEZN01011552.1/.p2  ORF type:complete len:223 (-),score=24.77 gb/GEZN01011552.1/:276-944(-)